MYNRHVYGSLRRCRQTTGEQFPSIAAFGDEVDLKADLAQLLGARSRCEELGEAALVHAKCLQILIDSESGEGRNVREMLDSNIELVRLYGAIAANRLYRMHPELLEYAASNSNQDVGMFATEALDVK